MTIKIAKFLLMSALGVASLTSGLAQAQQVFRIIGADGKVTFSDKPPASDTRGTVTLGSGVSGIGKGPALPFELRQIVAKYPVTLYVSDNCTPCTSARSMLLARGIPFAEKTVSSPADVQALQRLSGETSLPFATIGSQQLKGYSDAEWLQFLDAAGYPAASVLPTNYRPPAATSLVTIAAAPATAPALAGAPVRQAGPAAATPPVNNPAGIKF